MDLFAHIRPRTHTLSCTDMYIHTQTYTQTYTGTRVFETPSSENIPATNICLLKHSVSSMFQPPFRETSTGSLLPRDECSNVTE